MSSRWIGQLEKRSDRTSAVAALALSLLLTQMVSPFAVGALESPAEPQKATTAAVSSGSAKSDLDVQLDSFQKSIDTKTLSEADFQKLADLASKNPTNSRVHLLFGLGFDLQGLTDQAISQFELAYQYGPKDPEAIIALISGLIKSGASDSANKLLNIALQRFPDNPRVLYLMGVRLKEQKHYIQAGQALAQAYKSGEKIFGLPTELGDLMVNQDPRKAVYLAKLDLASAPDNAPSLVLLAKGLMFLGNYQLALPALEKLYKQAPTHEETTDMYVRSLFWCGEFEKALQPAFYSLRANSQYVVSDNRSAATLANVMKHVSANTASTALQSFYERVDREKIPVPPPFHFFVGRIFFRQHHNAQAKAELLRYYDADPKSAETLWMLGNIAENMDHDYPAALNYYRLGHALLPYNSTLTSACLSLEERLGDSHNDWAWCLRDWVYSTFSPNKH